jgi:hypothetical protein
MARFNKLYQPSYAKQVKGLFLLKHGALDKDIATFFGVSLKTIVNWKKAYPEFREAIQEGKSSAADVNVVQSLYDRATGYSHEAEKIIYDTDTKEVIRVPYTKQYPPETPAMRLWLLNRTEWKDRQTIEIEDPDELLSKVLGIKPEDLPE